MSPMVEPAVTTSRAPSLTLPTLVVHDQGDRINRFADGEAYRDHIAGATLLASGGLGHRKILQQAEVLQAVVDFVAVPALATTHPPTQAPRHHTAHNPWLDCGIAAAVAQPLPTLAPFSRLRQPSGAVHGRCRANALPCRAAGSHARIGTGPGPLFILAMRRCGKPPLRVCLPSARL
eukprot:gene25721-46826_t